MRQAERIRHSPRQHAQRQQIERHFGAMCGLPALQQKVTR